MNCELSKILAGIALASAAIVLATAWGWIVPLMVGYCAECYLIEGLGL